LLAVVLATIAAAVVAIPAVVIVAPRSDTVHFIASKYSAQSVADR
jgi:hypothetical protein